MTCFLSGAFYWMKQLSLIKVNFIKKECYLSCEHFSTLLQSEIEFFSQLYTKKNQFLSARYYWDGTISLRMADQKTLHGEEIGYGDSYLDSLFRYSKVFRLHAILHDAAGAVRLQTGKGPGYCNMIGRGSNYCLFGHVTGLCFCLYVKNLKLSVFNLIDFCHCLY